MRRIRFTILSLLLLGGDEDDDDDSDDEDNDDNEPMNPRKNTFITWFVRANYKY